MEKMLSEEVVKKKLKINNFRELTKDKVIKLASMIDKMDPEVAKKALDQFPKFAETNSEILNEYKSLLDTALESNEKSIETYYDACNALIESLKEQLQSEELTIEDKKYIISEMKDITLMIGEKDSENKRFIAAMASLGLGALVIIGGAISSVLGGNIKISSGNKEDEDDFI